MNINKNDHPSQCYWHCILCAVIGMLLFPMVSFAGPFGLSAGMTKTQLSKILKLKPSGKYSYEASKVPKPNSSFDSYILLVTPKAGLCKIMALGKIIATSVHGTELLQAHDTLSESLTKKYGSGTRYDFLKSGSIWREPQEWMMSLKLKERILATSWPETEGATLPDNLSNIIIEASALTKKTGLVKLTYEFSNTDACLDELRADDNSSL